MWDIVVSGVMVIQPLFKGIILILFVTTKMTAVAYIAFLYNLVMFLIHKLQGH